MEKWGLSEDELAFLDTFKESLEWRFIKRLLEDVMEPAEAELQTTDDLHRMLRLQGEIQAVKRVIDNLDRMIYQLKEIENGEWTDEFEQRRSDRRFNVDW
jgi:hypothetical protein